LNAMHKLGSACSNSNSSRRQDVRFIHNETIVDFSFKLYLSLLVDVIPLGCGRRTIPWTSIPNVHSTVG